MMRKRPGRRAIPLALLTLVAIGLAFVTPKHSAEFEDHPLIQKLCQHIDCAPLDPTQYTPDPAKLALGESLLYEGLDGFVLQFAVRNGANHPQPLPSVTLRLFDRNGSQLAARILQAASYVPQGDGLVIERSQVRDFRFVVGRIPAQTVRWTLSL